mmetsp:Transcript_37234/g.50390  ORF Transcript_37234/g.50390 Transcript_37234/m.50390 type:complete len:85 (+) Transcript_37234:539-793(+)
MNHLLRNGILGKSKNYSYQFRLWRQAYLYDESATMSQTYGLTIGGIRDMKKHFEKWTFYSPLSMELAEEQQCPSTIVPRKRTTS